MTSIATIYHTAARRFLLPAFLCAFFFFGPLAVFAQTTPDPGVPGSYAVLKGEYNLGDMAFKPPSFPDSVEVRGSVIYPATLAALGPLPVIMFLHGRHETCYDTSDLTNTISQWPCPPGFEPITSYEGYDYLGKNLASHGYVVISISCNSINATDNSVGDYGMQGRAELMQHHLDLWNTWNTTGSGPFGGTFVGKLNMQNIGTMGHSRGGEGVVFQALYNQSLGTPYGIKAVLTLAPVDFERHVLHGIPLLDVAPYCDGDVSDIQGVHFYDDSRYTDTTDYAPKHTVLFMGANHNFFSTVWTPGSYIAGGADDWLYSYSGTAAQCGPGNPLTKRFDSTKQKAALTAYMAAFYRVYIGHENEFAPILTVDDLVPPATSTLDSSQVYVSYHPSRLNRLDINRTDSTNKNTTNTLQGAVTESGLLTSSVCGGGLGMANCAVSTYGNEEPHRGYNTTIGLAQMHMKWGDTTDWYQNDIPQAYEDLSGYQSLSFRAAVNFKETTTGENLNFTVQLIDSAGNVASQPVNPHSYALFYQPGTQITDLPKVLFNTVKIPFSSFAGVDLSKIRHVKFLFNKVAAGSVLISDLAVSNAQCNINAAYTDSVYHASNRVTVSNTSYTGYSSDSVTYRWNFGDPASGTSDTSSLQNPVQHIFSGPGSYTACLVLTSYQKNSVICTDTFCKTLVIKSRVGVPELYENPITIIPNPAKDYLQIAGAEKTDVLQLVNITGEVVFTATISQPVIHLPASLPNGIYFAIVNTGQGHVHQKILINR